MYFKMKIKENYEKTAGLLVSSEYEWKRQFLYFKAFQHCIAGIKHSIIFLGRIQQLEASDYVSCISIGIVNGNISLFKWTGQDFLDVLLMYSPSPGVLNPILSMSSKCFLSFPHNVLLMYDSVKKT